MECAQIMIISCCQLSTSKESANSKRAHSIFLAWAVGSVARIVFSYKAMVKIKSGMSTDSSEGESEVLVAVKDKLKIQQRLIDISARSLLSSRSSTADLSQSFESQSALEVQRENISLLEVRVGDGGVIYPWPPPSRPGNGRYLKPLHM